MNKLQEQIDNILLRHTMAHNIAFNEINPHGNGMNIYEGGKAVDKRRIEIEAEAHNAIIDAVIAALPEKPDVKWNSDEAFRSKLEGYSLGIKDMEDILNSAKGGTDATHNS